MIELKIGKWIQKGYFLVHIDKRRKKNSCRLLPNIKKKIHENNMIAVVEGKTAIEIVNTLIREEVLYPHYNMLQTWELN